MIPPIARLLTLSVSTVLTAAAIDRLPEAPADRISWQATFGTEQRLELTSHLGIARSGLIPRGGLGMELTAEKPAEIKPVVGKFSGELRWFDFEGKVTKEVLGRAGKAPAGRGGVFKYGPRKDDKVTVNEDVRTSDEPLYMKRKVRGIDTLAYLRKSIAANVDQIWLLPQIQPEIAQQPYGLMDKQGVYFKDQVYECAKLVNSGEFANKSIEVYFEIGNEVNTPDRFSVRDHGPETFNPLNADDYVEYYLAPAVEAIRAASRDCYGDERRIKILSGSVTGILKAPGPGYLRQILNHTVRGDHAPSLAGKKAYELVDVVTVHYTNADPLLLSSLYNEWVGSGKVKGLWATEEGGWRGVGDYAVAYTSLRWLKFWSDKPWNRDTARMLTWGTKLDRFGTTTKGFEMELLLGSFLANYPLTAVEDRRELEMLTGADPEYIALRADLPDGGRRYVALFQPRLVTQFMLSWLRFKTVASPASIKVYRVPRATAFEPIDIKQSFDANGLLLDFENWDFSPDEMLLVMVDAPANRS